MAVVFFFIVHNVQIARPSFRQVGFGCAALLASLYLLPHPQLHHSPNQAQEDCTHDH
jgi:hypothetical protein